MALNLKLLTNDNIAFACDEFGAGSVFNAVVRGMEGDTSALPGVGLENGQNMGDMWRVMRIAGDLMEPEVAADVDAGMAIRAAKI
ncbi:hypothetical protein LPN04_31105 [Rugamonas sp. A1-17]|nr:hypothetical protein [Rugamonas sp. A1-17]